jgi:hypothetical protein
VGPRVGQVSELLLLSTNAPRASVVRRRQVFSGIKYLSHGEHLPLAGIVNLLSSLSSASLMCHTRSMWTPSTNHYKHHRFLAESISYDIWLYLRFCLSYRDVEEPLFARGIIVTYETIRQWCRKFGQAHAHQF